MADNKENSKVNTRSEKPEAVPRRMKIDKNKPKTSNRDPLKTLTGPNTENCSAGPSHMNRPNFAQHVTFRNNKKKHLDWSLEDFNDCIGEDLEEKRSVLENNRQSSIKKTEAEKSSPSSQTPQNSEGVENFEENFHTPRSVEGSFKTLEQSKGSDSVSSVSHEIYYGAVSICEDVTSYVGLRPDVSFDYPCRDYALDNIKYMLDIEKNILGQRMIEETSRAFVINWIININGSSGNPAIVQLASWYFDWYTTTTEVSMDKLQVIAAACYWIAAKYDGHYISINELLKYSNYAFIKEELLEDERNLLKKLIFQPLKVTPHDFVPYLSNCCDQSGTGVVEAAATFLCQCGVMINKHLNEEYPSAIAVAAVKNAIILLGKYTSSIKNLDTSMIYKASEKKASNINCICAQLRAAVRIVSSVDYKYKAPLYKFSGPPHFIANKIVKAVNSKLVLTLDSKK